MKVLFIGGSPRKGNTSAALDALRRGFSNIDGIELSQINAAEMKISPCTACDACRVPGHTGRCSADDDTNPVMEAVMDADFLIFATPVYWWGVTAQLKQLLDKFYSRTGQLAACKKRLGLIVVGEMPVDNLQYVLIEKQFRCICDYLGWDMVFCKTYSAKAKGELAENSQAMAELEELYREIGVSK